MRNINIIKAKLRAIKAKLRAKWIKVKPVLFKAFDYLLSAAVVFSVAMVIYVMFFNRGNNGMSVAGTVPRDSMWWMSEMAKEIKPISIVKKEKKESSVRGGFSVPGHDWLTRDEYHCESCSKSKNNEWKKKAKAWRDSFLSQNGKYWNLSNDVVAKCKRDFDVEPPACIIMARAIKESGWHTSEVAVRGNNLFGHKYFEDGKDWDGYVVVDGSKYRKYKSLWLCFWHEAKLLATRYKCRSGNSIGEWCTALCGKWFNGEGCYDIGSACDNGQYALDIMQIIGDYKLAPLDKLK